MPAIDRITRLLAQCASETTHLPPTTLYNEGWMLRLILDWCERHPLAVEPFIFLPQARWYSEALLPSRFGGRGGPREGFTHADGVIGHFQFRPGGRGDIELLPGRGSYRSSRRRWVAYYRRARPTPSRTIRRHAMFACMVHMIAMRGPEAVALERLSFTVIAPERRIMSRTSTRTGRIRSRSSVSSPSM